MKTIWAKFQRFLSVPWVHFVVDVFQRFGNDNGGFYAAGLAFFMLLSFAPIVLTGVAVLGFFIDVHTASVTVTHLIESFLPEGGARQQATDMLSNKLHVDDQVRAVIKHRGIAGLIGFLSLVWATLQIFVNAITPMNAMWEVKESRNFILVRVMALALTIITGCLLVFSIVLSSAPTAIAQFHLPIIRHIPIALSELTVFFELIALLLNAFMYVVIYKMLPNTNVTWYSACCGGAIASLLFEVAKKGLSTYLLHANTSIYGDLVNLILFALWIYYSMMILLLGAEFAAAFGRLEQAAPHAHKTSPNGLISKPPTPANRKRSIVRPRKNGSVG
jgi:membrane protein